MLQAPVIRFLGVQPKRAASRRWIVGGIAFQFLVAVYGGYFGAGIGILILASLGLMGFDDVHEMNTLKVILGFLINVVAAGYFIVAGLVQWPAAAIMACGTIIGGYTGARIAQRIPQQRVRSFITAVGLTISAVMFYRQFTSVAVPGTLPQLVRGARQRGGVPTWVSSHRGGRLSGTQDVPKTGS